MQHVDNRTALFTSDGDESTPTRSLMKIARRWDGGIRRELRQFAQFIWPNAHLLAWIPIRHFRLRKRFEREAVVWWVERDITPLDRYLCEAYRVTLSLAEANQPCLVVHSGISAYPVTPASIDGLKAALLRAGSDTPLVIPRRFGPALDP